ncbi:MAG TPA: putative 4-mercaptohistidine N1-methyltransferase [Thermoanaerobaculia bacterium]|nr:putative 4-mercaptohistidine N1-methyltransferase [Thermoanaerobaculia bacterium]
MTTRRSDAPTRSSDAPDYESRRAVDQYLLFHYGSTEEVLPYPFGPRDALGYPARCAHAALDAAKETPRRALDLGCAVGGTTFALALMCDEVVGIDLSSAFVAAAEALRRDGSLPYARVEEGDRTTQLVARVPQGIDRSRVRFEVGDATALPSGLGVFDVIVLANLIDRVADPPRCLEQAGSLVRPGGVLFVSSPYTWLVEATPRDRWLGGRAGAWSSFETLRTQLEPRFELLQRREMPFLLREHARKYQWSVADATTWQRS